jgi:hypothetical protein
MKNYKVIYKGKVISQVNFNKEKKYFILGFNSTATKVDYAGFVIGSYTNGSEIKWFKKYKQSGLVPNYVVYEFQNNQVEVTDDSLEKNFTKEYVNRFHTKIEKYGTISGI